MGCLRYQRGYSLEKMGLTHGRMVGMGAEDLFAGHPGILQSIERSSAGEVVSVDMQWEALSLAHWSGPIHDDQGRQIGVGGLAIDRAALPE